MAAKKGQPPNQSKSAKKRAAAKKTPQARAYSKPGKVKESGSAGYAAARAAQYGIKAAKKAVAKQNKAADTYKTVDPKRSEAAKKAAKTRAANEKARQKKMKLKAEGKGAVKGLAVGGTIAAGYGESRRRDKKKK
jgi:hypothetical protein